MVQGIIAGGTPALTRSQEGAEDRLEGAVEDLNAHGVRAGDFVIGIAASGTTPYVRRALSMRAIVGAATALVACSPRRRRHSTSPTSSSSPLTGPEVVTGSTRMKAGTATKLVLNTITTGAMIRLGKTFGNLMVDLRATNDKLRDRSERILMEVCDVERDDARDAARRRRRHREDRHRHALPRRRRDEAERALATRGRRDPPRRRARSAAGSRHPA